MVKPKFKSEASKSKFAVIWIDRSSGRLCLRTPYHEEYLLEFKALVPPEDRKWDKELKIWYIVPQYLQDVVKLTEKYFKLDVLPEISDDGNYYKQLLEHVSHETLKKIWRLIAFELHPDRPTGDARKFVMAQEAFQKITGGK